MDARSAELLRASQRQWLAWRAAEHAAQIGPWRNDRGSIARIEVLDAELSAIRERVSELRVYASD